MARFWNAGHSVIFEEGVIIMKIGQMVISYILAAVSGICFVSGLAVLSDRRETS